MKNITTDFRSVPAEIGFERSDLNVQELRMASGACLASDLAQVVSETIFDIPRLVEAARDQRFDPFLGSRPPKRSDARIPVLRKKSVHREFMTADVPEM